MLTGIIGKKVGMTQIFDPDGTVHPATVIKAGPCVVVQSKLYRLTGTTRYNSGSSKKHRPSRTSRPSAISRRPTFRRRA